jgi:hypothetical protein
MTKVLTCLKYTENITRVIEGNIGTENCANDSSLKGFKCIINSKYKLSSL